MCDAIVNKLLHTPLTQLKKSREEPDGDQLVSSVRKLFLLDEEPTSARAPLSVPGVVSPATLVPSKSSSGDRS